MNQAIARFLAQRSGRWVNLMIRGTIYTGKVASLCSDGLAIQTVTGATVAITGSLVEIAAECDNELVLEEMLSGAIQSHAEARH